MVMLCRGLLLSTLEKPTAQTSFDPIATTPTRTLSPAPWFGVWTTLHALPFQCSASVLATLPVLKKSPTAHTSLAVTALMAFSSLPPPSAFALVTAFHVELHVPV